MLELGIWNCLTLWMIHDKKFRFFFFMQFNLVHFVVIHLVVIEHNAPTIGWHLQTSQHLDFYNVSWKVNNGNVFNVSYNWHNQLGNQNMDLDPSSYLYISLKFYIHLCHKYLKDIWITFLHFSNQSEPTYISTSFKLDDMNTWNIFLLYSYPITK
jgi:hypothetical protein